MNLYIELIQFVSTLAAGILVVCLYVALKRSKAEQAELQRKLDVSFQRAVRNQQFYEEKIKRYQDNRQEFTASGALEVHWHSLNNSPVITKEEREEAAKSVHDYYTMAKAAHWLGKLDTDQLMALILRHVEARLGALACQADTFTFGRMEESRKYTRMAGRVLRQVTNFRKENKL